jgi:CRISPR-associated protein Cst2
MYNTHTTTHLCGCFLIDAPASFLNGAGIGDGEDRNVSIVKTFRDGQFTIPYVSSQSWKRWLRNTLIEETGWNASILRALHTNVKGNTDKIGGEFNPVDFAEDDIFGYMRTEKGGINSSGAQGSDGSDIGITEDNTSDDKDLADLPKRGKKVKPLTRASPFSASILMSLRRSGWRGRDEGFVHLREGTPQPYTTEFYHTTLQGIFTLNIARLGLFSNLGDRIEIDEQLAGNFVSSGKLIIKKDEGNLGKIYEISDALVERNNRTAALIRSLVRLRGGAKQAAFATDVSPKVIIISGLSCGNPIYNSIFSDEGNGAMIKINVLKEIISDYDDRITTPVILGVRNGYLKNEQELLDYSKNESKLVITTPIEAANKIIESIK